MGPTSKNFRRFAPAATLEVIGHRADGRPIHAIRGADEMGTLLAERDDLLSRLADPGDGDDVDALSTRALEVAEAIEAENTRRGAAAEARNRLAGANLEERGNGGGSGSAGATGGARFQTRDRQPAPGSEDRGGEALTARRLGESFVNAEGFGEFRAGGFNGNFQIEMPGDVRALVDSTTWPQQNTRVPDFIAPPDRPTRIIDLIDRRGITSSTLEYVREVTAQSNAAEVAEGALKPEASFDLEVITDSVRTIATWVNITRQTAEDNSQVQGYIEGRLVYGLDRRLETAVIAGNGTSPNLRGILNTSGLGTYTAPSGEAAVISVRKAKTVAELSEYPPDAVAMNPVDWQRIELSTDNNGAFRVTPNVQNSLAPRIWGLTVVTTTDLSGTTSGVGAVGGTFLLGGFRMGATLWERQGIRILMTDSHASNFTSNILTLLAEMRAGLSVWRPAAFVKGTFSNNGDGNPTA